MNRMEQARVVDEKGKARSVKRLRTDAGDSGVKGEGEREGCTYKSLNRCFSRIRNFRKTFPSLPCLFGRPLVLAGLSQRRSRVENA